MKLFAERIPAFTTRDAHSRFITISNVDVSKFLGICSFTFGWCPLVASKCFKWCRTKEILLVLTRFVSALCVTHWGKTYFTHLSFTQPPTSDAQTIVQQLLISPSSYCYFWFHSTKQFSTVFRLCGLSSHTAALGDLGGNVTKNTKNTIIMSTFYIEIVYKLL